MATVDSVSLDVLAQRVAELEVQVVALKKRAPPAKNWMDVVVGSLEHEPEFDEVLRLGREYRAANRPNLPMYAGGSKAFMGDYISIAPTTPFVPATSLAPAPITTNGRGNGRDQDNDKATDKRPKTPPTPFWRWATEPTDTPTPAFVAVWGDNRDVVFPYHKTIGSPTLDGPWWEYAPPGFGPCINPGSRNANVYSAFVSPRLASGTPTSFKQLGIQRAFVLFVWRDE